MKLTVSSSPSKTAKINRYERNSIKTKQKRFKITFISIAAGLILSITLNIFQFLTT